MIGVTSFPILQLRDLHDEGRLGPHIRPPRFQVASGSWPTERRPDFSLNCYPCFPWPIFAIFLPNIRDLEAENQGCPDLPSASFQAYFKSPYNQINGSCQEVMSQTYH
jgi:hypothetical protein